MSRKKAALAIVATLLVILGGFAAFVYYKYHQSRDIRGSHDRVHPDGDRAAAGERRRKIVWPDVRLRLRAHCTSGRTFRCGRRSAELWTAGGARLLEFPPVIGVRPALPRRRRRARARVLDEDGRAGVDVRRAPLPGRVAGGRRHAARHDLRVFLNRRPCKAKRRGDGEVIALSAGRERCGGRRHIGASETSPVVIGNRLYVGDWLGNVYALDKRTGAHRLDRAHRRRGEGRRRGERQPRLRRLVRRPPLCL